MDKVISPLTQGLKRNSDTINMVLLGLIVLMLFPLEHFVDYNIKENVKTELKTLMENVWIQVLLSVVVFAVFQAGNLKMLVLLLYFIHHIMSH